MAFMGVVMSLLPRKNILAIAAVIDIALNARNGPVAAKAMAPAMAYHPGRGGIAPRGAHCTHGLTSPHGRIVVYSGALNAAQADGLPRRQLMPSPRITVRNKIMKRVVSKRRFSQQWASHNTSRTIRESR